MSGKDNTPWYSLLNKRSSSAGESVTTHPLDPVQPMETPSQEQRRYLLRAVEMDVYGALESGATLWACASVLDRVSSFLKAQENAGASPKDVCAEFDRTSGMPEGSIG